MVSINTNANQLSALQLLNSANGQLHEIENRIATGLKVATAKDNGAIWGMAVAARSALGDYEVLDRARDHANGLVDVTLSATEVVSDLVDRMNELALASTDPSLSDTARASLNEQFQMLKRQIDRTVGSASFDGINLLDSNGSNCQTAFKTDPRSASNIDPSSLCSRTGGEARSGQLAQRVAA